MLNDEDDKVKTRRVGDLTTGVFFMFIGIIMLLNMFIPSSDIINLFKISPVFLIMFGIEILYYNFKNNNENIKYNILGIFMCFIIFFCSKGFMMILNL